MRSDGGTRQRPAFTLIELLIVISIIAMLAALLMPAVGMVKRAANGAVCANSQRQIGLANGGYQADWNAQILSSATDTYWMWSDNGWCYLALPYLGFDLPDSQVYLVKPNTRSGVSRLFTCPENKAGRFGGNWSSFNMNYYASSQALWYGQAGPARVIGTVTQPSAKVYLADWQDFAGGTSQFLNEWTFFTFDKALAARHNRSANLLFLDGHVKGYSPPTLPVLSTTDVARARPWIYHDVPGSPDF